MIVKQVKHAFTSKKYNIVNRGIRYDYINHFTNEKTEVEYIPHYCEDGNPILITEITTKNGDTIPITETKVNGFNDNTSLSNYIDDTNMKELEAPEWYLWCYDCENEYLSWIEELKTILNKDYDEVIQEYYGDTIGNEEFIYIDFIVEIETLTENEIKILNDNGYEVKYEM
jgi:hypothetical protein